MRGEVARLRMELGLVAQAQREREQHVVVRGRGAGGGARGACWRKKGEGRWLALPANIPPHSPLPHLRRNRKRRTQIFRRLLQPTRPPTHPHPFTLLPPTLPQELQAENTRLQGELLQSRLELQSSLAEALKLLTDGA